MPGIRELRSRIRSVQNIHKITKAMKMVAAARQKKAQDRVNAARPFSQKMAEVMQNLASSTSGNPASIFSDSSMYSPAAREAEQLLTTRDVHRHGLLIISGERGLAGGYNSNILRKAMNTIEGVPKEDVRVIAVGRKAISYFQKRGFNVVLAKNMPTSAVPFSLAQEVGEMSRHLYTTGEVDCVNLVYTRSLSAMSQKPTDEQLLPVEVDSTAANGAKDSYIYEPSAPELLSSLVPRYVDTLIYQAILEANAGEQGARMIAMSAATDNAKEVETSLTLITNRVRQATITKELLEVVGGAEALNN